MKKEKDIFHYLLILIIVMFFSTIMFIAVDVAFPYNENTIFVKNAIQSTVAIVSTSGVGAGTFIHPDGYIGTAKHVIEGADDIFVYTRDWEVYRGRVVAMHEKQDVAIVKVELIKDIKIIEIAPLNTIEVADDIYVIGHTFGIPWTISKGIIARTDWETEDGWKYIQFSSASATGNSGGAVVDHWGRMVAMTVMGLPLGAADVGFALQIHQFEEWAEDIIDKDIKRMNVLINW